MVDVGPPNNPQPEGDELQRVTARDWCVVNAATGGITFSISDDRHDARLSAEHWLQVCGTGHQLEIRTFEYWVSPTRETNREVVAHAS